MFRVEAIFTDLRDTRFYGYDWKKDDIPLYTSSVGSLVDLCIQKLGRNLYLITTTPPNTGTDIPPVEGSTMFNKVDVLGVLDLVSNAYY